MKRKQIIAENEISEIREFVLGGFPQKVAIDGRKRDNPVVIFLHGGPGSPIPFSVGCRGMFPEMTEAVTMIYWDQLGCGINNYPVNDDFRIQNFVEMTKDLIIQVKKLFPENELLLFGVSWGSILALKVVTEYAVPVDCVVTYGQVLCDLTFNKEVYKALEASAMPAGKKKELQEIQKHSSHTLEEGKKIMKWIRQYTEGYQCKSGGKLPIGSMVWGLLTSPDYRLRDFKAVMVNGYMKNSSLLKELFRIDLQSSLKQVKVSYKILQGSTDLVTPTKTVVDFVKELGNPYVTCQVIENCGHMPADKGMNEIMEVVKAGRNGISGHKKR